MNDRRQSDRPIRLKRSPNNAPGAPGAAEGAEERGLTKENPQWQNSFWTQGQDELRRALLRVRQVAERDPKVQFTTLWHHVYKVDALREAYFGLKAKAAPGVDRTTHAEYGKDLEANLADLSSRLRRGAYRAKPVRRVYIAKPDGRQRPLGVTALEDKIVQSATVRVLNAIYETDFLGFSYGFRPGRSPHDALDAVFVGLTQRKVNWVLDADIRGFFDTINHEWLMKFVEHRIADQRVLRHIKKWLNAGVLEDGEIQRVGKGTPQGASISPLLANIYLHYVLDLWAHDWRQKHATGDVVIVRYADDFVVGFQHRREAESFLAAAKARLGRFDLSLHPEKTRLIEFGRFAAERRAERGLGKPETFDFLGFTHACSKTRKGHYTIQRRTMRKRIRGKLAQIKHELRRRMHDRVRDVGRWLGSVLSGHYGYYGVPLNSRSLAAMRVRITQLWYRTLRRRSQRTRIDWSKMHALADKYLPRPVIRHPWPDQRLRVTIQGRSPVR